MDPKAMKYGSVVTVHYIKKNDGGDQSHSHTLQPLKFRSITCLQFLTKCFMPVSVTLKFDRQDILINIFVCFILYKKLKVQ